MILRQGLRIRELKEEEDSALERPLNEGQKSASWLENGMENVRGNRWRRQGSPDVV